MPGAASWINDIDANPIAATSATRKYREESVSWCVMLFPCAVLALLQGVRWLRWSRQVMMIEILVGRGGLENRTARRQTSIMTVQAGCGNLEIEWWMTRILNVCLVTEAVSFMYSHTFDIVKPNPVRTGRVTTLCTRELAGLFGVALLKEQTISLWTMEVA